VADDVVVPDGDQGQVRQEADVRAQLVGQPGLGDVVGPVRAGRPKAARWTARTES
jgi:hypothetical protein